ncbi:uncharacterized protein LOC125746656 [Brienomyrus brachyistius]|uniref:uncharacterized protein LOC125746656 n=1 Tax=Brienomyrus brachyistius TaxID=42636 RepID=UPI0020B35684|nr:uncharacterized protein LOC125746656 [Brienomyrus brachyistius]
MADFEQEFLEAHNAYRQDHGAPPLTLSRELCVSAQSWADHLLAIQMLKHNPQSDKGENIFCMQSSSPMKILGKQPVEKWYNEIKDYDFSRPGFTPNTGHFTQVVWKDTKELGVGIATDGTTIFVVGQYLPPGNMNVQSYFERNVLPPAGKVSGSDSKPPSPTTKDTTSPTSSTQLFANISEFQKEALEAHNAWRQQHGAPPLSLDLGLCREAQKWAEHLAQHNMLQHSDTDLGQNILSIWSSDKVPVSGKYAVELLYREIKDYDFSKPGYQTSTGHFTQVVWKDSQEMGIDMATDSMGKVIVVAHYRPAGNNIKPGYYERNVLPPQEEGGRGSDNKTPTPTTKDTTSPTGPTELSANTADFQKEALEAHNARRQQHGAPPLSLDLDLCRETQKWAEHLVQQNALQHSDTDLGENIFYKWTSDKAPVSGKDAVESWYSEIKDYDFSKSGHQEKTGHFTQVVWKDSQEMGIGMATDGKGKVFVVAQYRPAGNITNPGYYERNVLPPQEGGGSGGENKPPTPTTKDTTSPIDPNGLSANTADFQKEALEAHNARRQQHGAPPLSLDLDLCRETQKWAEHLAQQNAFQHSDTDLGENIFYKWTSDKAPVSGKDAVESWYSEIKDYDFSKSGHQEKTGHFTQVVWKDSQEMGIGMATDGKGTVFVVAQYRPAGNITNPGYYERNVLPPQEGGGSGGENKPPTPTTKDTTSPIDPNGLSANTADFQKEALEAHNARRQQHGAPPLSLDLDLCRETQKWAEHLAQQNAFQHSDTDLGENIFYKWTSDKAPVSGKDAVESWYSEIKDYDFSKSGHQEKTGHFTQVVWKDSQEMGIGMATDGKGTVFVVAQYRPAGNITNPGYYERNVLPPQEGGGSGGENKPPTPTTKDTTSPIDPNGLSANTADFQKEALEAHNARRQQHGAPPLSLDLDLCRETQKWAEHLAQQNAFQHSDTDLGENIFYKWTSDKAPVSGKDAVESWYSEIKDYDFSKSGHQEKTGHFTQVVWKDSQEMGIGMATDGKGKVFVVAQYRPAGNITNPGYYERNVLPPQEGGGSGGENKPPTPTTKDTTSPIDPNGLSANTADFQKEALEAHNARRQQHGAPPLSLDLDLCRETQKWAEHLAQQNAFQHSDTDLGENIFYKWTSDKAPVSGKDAVESWYSEIKDYDFSKSGHQEKTGHFTQVVWKDSQEMGIGMATDGKGTVFVVAQYRPAGNITNPGYYERNVLPPQSKGTY